MTLSLRNPLLDRCIPPRTLAHGDLEVLLRYRMVLTVALLLGFISPTLSLMNLIFPVWWPGTTSGALLTVVAWSVPFQTRLGVQPRVCTLQLLTGLIVCLTMVSTAVGGVFSPSVSWIAMAPALGLAMDGPQTARRAALLALAAILVLGGLTYTGTVYPMEVDNRPGAVLFTVAAVALALILFLVGWAGERVRTATHEELHRTNEELTFEVDEHEKTRHRLHRVHQELVDAAHVAGAAQVATGILHNLGNALNAVQVSTGLAESRLTGMRLDRIGALGKLLEGKVDDKVIRYTTVLSQELEDARIEVRDELRGLRSAVEHAVAIVATQQRHAVRTSVTERIDVPELLRDAVSLCSRSDRSAELTVTCGSLSPVVVDRHRLLQILTNLISNAYNAVAGHDAGRVEVTARRDGMKLQIAVRDNGTGIAVDDLERVFAHGFTTRRDGHGFGLHASALAARELGGSLTAHSDGPGTGACFVITVPVQEPSLLRAENPYRTKTTTPGRG